MGYVISSTDISGDPSKVKVLLNWELPTNVFKVRNFLSLVGYYHHFAKLVAPVIDITNKGVQFELTEKCEEAFQD